MTEDEMSDLYERLDWAERRVYELRDELNSYPEDGSEWLSALAELNEAENELEYIRKSLEDEGY